MKRFSRLSALLLALVMSISLLSGCGEEEEDFSLSVGLPGRLGTLDPIYSITERDNTVLTHLYENLMRTTVSTSGEVTVVNALAKSADQETNEDGTVTWTFRLRKAEWSDGEPVKAQDFVYAWRRLADPLTYSPNAAILSMVAGFEEARTNRDMSLLQVNAKSDSVLEVVLSGTCEWFLNEVCTSPATVPLREDVVQRLADEAVAREEKEQEERAQDTGDEESQETKAPEWWAHATQLVTSGPYTVSAQTEDRLELKAAGHYFAEGGPDRLEILYAKDADALWEMYENKEVDFIWPVPDEQLKELPEQYQIPTLSTFAVLYNGTDELLQDAQIRRAMTLSLDRNQLSELAGVMARPAVGLVPDGVPGMEGKTFREMSGELLDNDPDHNEKRYKEALDVLSEAGYRSGVDLEPMEYIYMEGEGQKEVAEALAQQWWNILRLKVEPVAVTPEEMDAALRSGEYQLAGIPVNVVGNDAECFLRPWSSGVGANVLSYTNSAYDTLVSIIATASDSEARIGCMRDAELLLLEDCALAPLYNTCTGWKLRETFTGVCRDARGFFSFAHAAPQSVA